MKDSEPKPGEKYSHFKSDDKKYEIICVAKDCENPENKFVIYKSLYESEFPVGTIWIRELKDFCGNKKFSEDVEYNGEKFKAGDEVKRFRRIENGE